jgi:hypothetical protein
VTGSWTAARLAASPLLALALLAPTACGGSTPGSAPSSTAAPNAASGATDPSSSPPAAATGGTGPFCDQLRSLISWQTAHADEVDSTAFLAESARRYRAMESAAPADYQDTIRFFAEYAAEPAAQAASAPGFTEQARKLAAAATDVCHIEPASP